MEPEIKYCDGDMPEFAGVYVAYVNPAHPEIPRADRIILLYHVDWFYQGSDQKYRGIVYGYVGPLPHMPLED
jgi:hypothetical protein